MTKKLLSLMIVIGCFLSIPASKAAFPVNEAKTTQTTANPSQAQSVAPAQTVEVVKKETAKKEKKSLLQRLKAGGGKSQLVALILALVVGGIGIHRFYLGYTWQGVVQLLTLGGCGIWSLIDLIRIAIGDLEPKNGPYDKTL
jgi:TM2 domain-containing membrane protein YozV